MSKYFIGLHYGHNATVAVARNGEVIFCQSEERLNRIKNSTGFPSLTLDYIYSTVCSPDEVTSITLFQKSIFGYLFLKQHEFKSFQSGQYFAPEIRQRGWFSRSELRWQLSQWRARHVRENDARLKAEAIRFFAKSARVPERKIQFIQHHAAHAYSTIAHIQSWANALVFTLDGVGDYSSATVSKLENGVLQVLQETNHRNSLGYFYAAITGLLGMKVGEHEFKVMGLAPYSSQRYYKPILDRLKQLIWLDRNGQFVARLPPTALMEALDEIILHQRFDNVAGAIQALVEELIIEWIRYWTTKTNILNIAVAGGVFMNVKACQRVFQEIPIDKYFIMPSAADESTAIGAAYWAGIQSTPQVRPVPFRDLYMGREFSDDEISLALSELDASGRYQISKPDRLNRSIAELLSNNQVVARFAGRMEFGARALGNRSILANPNDFSTVELINASIKNRDFWMPFTPSILAEDMPRYIVDHERIFAPYMSITFETTDLARQHLKAAIHPRDKTARPQCVLSDWNPGYYDVISEFKKLTGIGAVLNTSFNLHGEPNVCSPHDAIHTMDNSGLKYLAIGSFLLEKKSKGS